MLNPRNRHADALKLYSRSQRWSNHFRDKGFISNNKPIRARYPFFRPSCQTNSNIKITSASNLIKCMQSEIQLKELNLKKHSPYLEYAREFIRSSDNLKKMPKDWEKDFAYIMSDQEARKLILKTIAENIFDIDPNFINFIESYAKHRSNLISDLKKQQKGNTVDLSPKDYLNLLMKLLYYEKDVIHNLMIPIVKCLNCSEEISWEKSDTFRDFLIRHIDIFTKNYDLDRLPYLMKYFSKRDLLYAMCEKLNLIYLSERQIYNLLYLSESNFDYFLWFIEKIIKNHNSKKTCQAFGTVILEQMEKLK